jgi:chromate transporter
MLWRLTVVFTVLSVLGFGGGNTIFPQMYRDVVDHYHWVTASEFARYFALGRLAPGPGTTMSALVGYKVAGFVGALVAAIATFLPAAIIVFGIAHLWDRFAEHPWRDPFARAMVPIVLGLTWIGVVFLGHGALDAAPSYAIMLGVAALSLWTRLNASLIVLLAGVAGIVFYR